MIWPSGVYIACKSLNASISDINCPPPKPGWPSANHNIYITCNGLTAILVKYAKYVCLMEAIPLTDISASQKHYHMRAWSDWPVAFSAMHFPFKRILVMMYTSMGVAISRQNKFCTQPRNVHDRVEQDQEMFSGQKIGAWWLLWFVCCERPSKLVLGQVK